MQASRRSNFVFRREHMLCQRCGMENDQRSQNCAYCGAPVAMSAQPASAPQPVYHQVYAASIQGVVYQPPVAPPSAQEPAKEEPVDYPIPAADFSQKKEKRKRQPHLREGFGDAVLRLSGVGFKGLSREDKRKTILQLVGLVLAVIAGSAAIQDLLL